MGKKPTTPVIVLTRLKAGGKVWPQTMPGDDPAKMPDDLVEDLLDDEVGPDSLIRLADVSDTPMGVGGLTSLQQAAVETAIRALPEGEAPTAQKINAALKEADAGFTVKAAQIEAVRAALKTAEE